MLGSYVGLLGLADGRAHCVDGIAIEPNNEFCSSRLDRPEGYRVFLHTSTGPSGSHPNEYITERSDVFFGRRGGWWRVGGGSGDWMLLPTPANFEAPFPLFPGIQYRVLGELRDLGPLDLRERNCYMMLTHEARTGVFYFGDEAGTTYTLSYTDRSRAHAGIPPLIGTLYTEIRNDGSRNYTRAVERHEIIIRNLGRGRAESTPIDEEYIPNTNRKNFFATY